MRFIRNKVKNSRFADREFQFVAFDAVLAAAFA
jgi:hypothetical protein